MLNKMIALLRLKRDNIVPIDSLKRNQRIIAVWSYKIINILSLLIDYFLILYIYSKKLKNTDYFTSP